MLSAMAFTPQTGLPADVQTAQGNGHLAHHQALRANVIELREAGLLVASDLNGLARRALTQKPITANYTLVTGDQTDTILHVTASAAITITLPSGLVQESSIPWRQFGAGQISFAPASGMTLVSRGGATKSNAQYSGGILTLVNSTTWLLEGDVVA